MSLLSTTFLLTFLFFLDNLEAPIFIFKLSNYKIYFFKKDLQTILDVYMIYNKIIVLNVIYIFVVATFLI